MQFDIIDLFLLGGLGFAVYRGYVGGVAKKLFTILALIGSIVLAVKLMAPVGGFFVNVILLSDLWGYVAGFVLVLGISMGTALLVYNKFHKNTMAKSSSQFFGMLFGLFEGALIISLILLMLKVFDTPDKDTREDSLLYRPLVNFAPRTFDLMRSYLPGAASFRQELSNTFKKYGIFEEAVDANKRL